MDKKDLEKYKDEAATALENLADGASELLDDIDSMKSCMDETDTILANADETNWSTAIEDARKKLSEYV